MKETHPELVERLKASDYAAVGHRLSNPTMIDINHAVMGIASEGGELADALKRHIFYGTEFDIVNAKEEVGDILWYVELLCQACGFTMEEAKELNVDKLTERYGTGEFTEDAAVNRDVDAERVILEESNKVAGEWHSPHDKTPDDEDVVEVEWLVDEYTDNALATNYAHTFVWDLIGSREKPESADILKWRFAEVATK